MSQRTACDNEQTDKVSILAGEMYSVIGLCAENGRIDWDQSHFVCDENWSNCDKLCAKNDFDNAVPSNLKSHHPQVTNYMYPSVRYTALKDNNLFTKFECSVLWLDSSNRRHTGWMSWGRLGWINLVCAYETVSLPARRYAIARVFVSATCLSVCPSLRLSVTHRYCIKTKKARVMFCSPSGSPTILVFWCQISSQNSKGVTPSGGVKQGMGG